MTRKKRRRGSAKINNLSERIVRILKEDHHKSFNYKQLCAKIGITDASGRNQVIKKLAQLKAKEQIIEVEIDYRVEDVLLQQLPNVSDVRNTGGFIYEITFSTAKDMRPAVFDFAHDNQLKTLQLSRKNKNLESLFTELTS